MLDPTRAKALLDGLAERFENAIQASPVENARGWGQFLDGPVISQIGSYGTSAGLIVRGLAGRGGDGLSVQTAALVRHWWSSAETDQEPRAWFSQTLRLAFLHLALRLSGNNTLADASEEVASSLLSHLLPGGMWGNYWTPQEYDPTPRLFPTAIALLSFTLLREPGKTNKDLSQIADKIEERVLGSPGLPLLHAAAAAAAILATKGKSVSRTVKRKIADLAYHGSPNLGDLGVYFYDYPKATGQGNDFGRDYFIVPTEMLIGIAGFQTGSPLSLRRRAEIAADLLTSWLDENDGVYRPDSEQRISSKNQAWAGLFLALAGADPEPVSKGAKVWYALRRTRRENWFTEKVFPPFSMATVTALNVFIPQNALWARAVTTVLFLVVAGIYGPTVFRVFFPGRK